MPPWLETLGIRAHAVMGHSLGEFTAAVISEAFPAYNLLLRDPEFFVLIRLFPAAAAASKDVVAG